jgi:hypothetical protein
MEYDDLPIAVPIAVVSPPASTAAASAPAFSPHIDEEMPSAAAAAAAPDTTTTTIDRSTNTRDGSLSISINTTTHYPNGHRERKIEYYRIPRNMVARISTALDTGHMPATSYLIRMEQQSLPPGTADLPLHQPPSSSLLSSQNAVVPTTLAAAAAAGSIRQSQNHRHHYGRSCGICACSTITFCIVISIVIIIVAVFVIQPWNMMVHPSSSTSMYDDNNHNSNNHDGYVGSWTTPVPTATPHY